MYSSAVKVGDFPVIFPPQNKSGFDNIQPVQKRVNNTQYIHTREHWLAWLGLRVEEGRGEGLRSLIQSMCMPPPESFLQLLVDGGHPRAVNSSAAIGVLEAAATPFLEHPVLFACLPLTGHRND